MNTLRRCIALYFLIALSGCVGMPDVKGKPVPTAFFVFFEKDSATPNAEAKQVFDEAAAYLIQYDNTTVRIVGHISKDETAADLDRQRASHAAEELAKRGAQPVRMKLFGMGTKESLSDNPSVGDPSIDRRVEILFSTM
jgi:outer membrane protein OmpA-like peptidoglycan-associated protein